MELYNDIAEEKIATIDLPKAHLDLCTDSYKDYFEIAKANEVTSAIDEICEFISEDTKKANIVAPLSTNIIQAFNLLKLSTTPVLMSFELQTHANFVRSCLRNQAAHTLSMYYDLTQARMHTKIADAHENRLKEQFNAFSTTQEQSTNKKMRICVS